MFDFFLWRLNSFSDLFEEKLGVGGGGEVLNDYVLRLSIFFCEGLESEERRNDICDKDYSKI
jgi:hypothetical protein